MKTTLLALVIVGLIVFFANAPYHPDKRIHEARLAHTDEPARDLEFAIVWPKTGGQFFVEGAQLAVAEINQRGGVTIADARERPVKVKLKAHVYDEPPDATAGKAATQLASNIHLSAVIGHNSPDGAIAASVAYEDNGLVYLSPNVSDLRLSSHGLRMFFQTIPDDKAIATALIRFALEQGWNSAAILYARDSYGMIYANLLREQIGQLKAKASETAEAKPLDLVMQESFSDSPEGFYLIISQLLEKKFDVVIVIDSLVGHTAPRALKMVKQLREMGVTQPILGTEELNLLTLWNHLGPRANNIYTAAMFDFVSKRSSPASREFYAKFQARYKAPPTEQCAAAYEAVHLLAQAAERARSKVPIKIATMLKSTHDWHGLQGEKTYDFNINGTIRDKAVWVHGMKDGDVVEVADSGLRRILVNSNLYSNLESGPLDYRLAHSRHR